MSPPDPATPSAQPGPPEPDSPGRFPAIGGRPCLDFTNTLDGTRAAPGPDGLVAYDDLVAWGRQMGTLEAGEARRLLAEARRRPPEAKRVLERARVLREAMYRVFMSHDRSEALVPADLDAINAELSRALEQSRVTVAAEGFRLGWSAADALDRVLWAVARSAADLLTSRDLARVRSCGSDDCDWLFLDATKNRRRRWCDMASCGNREKAKRHRDKRRGR